MKDSCDLIGKTLPEAQKALSGTRISVKKTCGRFAPENGAFRVVRARAGKDGWELTVSKFLEHGEN